MTTFEFYTVIILVAAAVLTLLAAWIRRRGILNRFLSNREQVILGKIVFMVFVAMLYIVIQNARGVPVGQFIYGRF